MIDTIRTIKIGSLGRVKLEEVLPVVGERESEDFLEREATSERGEGRDERCGHEAVEELCLLGARETSSS